MTEPDLSHDPRPALPVHLEGLRQLVRRVVTSALQKGAAVQPCRCEERRSDLARGIAVQREVTSKSVGQERDGKRVTF